MPQFLLPREAVQLFFLLAVPLGRAATREAGRLHGGPTSDDAKHSLELLELQLKSVRFSMEGLGVTGPVL